MNLFGRLRPDISRCVICCLTLSGRWGRSMAAMSPELLSNAARFFVFCLIFFFFLPGNLLAQATIPSVSDSRSALSDGVRISRAGRHHPLPALLRAHVGCEGAVSLPCVHAHFQSSPNMSVTAAFSAARQLRPRPVGGRDASQAN